MKCQRIATRRILVGNECSSLSFKTAARRCTFLMMACRTEAFHVAIMPTTSKSLLAPTTKTTSCQYKGGNEQNQSPIPHYNYVSRFAHIMTTRISSIYSTTRCFSVMDEGDGIYDISSGSTAGESTASSSAKFAVSPDSEQGRMIVESLGISAKQHDQLANLADLVVQWNERLNLISRKDCNLDVVFGRHILPSVALAGVPNGPLTKSGGQRIVDVGTGGGFPGLPLAIIFPESEFLLVDSVGKKLKAIDEMVAELGLTNIQTHHGRAEEIVDDPNLGRRHKGAYDVCVGRSVTALPRFCFWIQDLLKKKRRSSVEDNEEDGKLMYIIGGDIEPSVLSRVQSDIPIDKILNCEGASDKRVLVLGASDIFSIAKESGEKRQKRGQGKKRNNQKKKSNDAKGKWTKKDNSVVKERGYENFKRVV